MHSWAWLRFTKVLKNKHVSQKVQLIPSHFLWRSGLMSASQTEEEGERSSRARRCSTLAGRLPAVPRRPHLFPLCSALIKGHAFVFLLLPFVSSFFPPSSPRSVAHPHRVNCFQRQQVTLGWPLSHFLPLSSHPSLTHPLPVCLYPPPLVLQQPTSLYLCRSLLHLYLSNTCLLLFFFPLPSFIVSIYTHLSQKFPRCCVFACSKAAYSNPCAALCVTNLA